MWEKIKELAGDVYAITGIAWVLTHLVLILIHGKLVVYENNPWVLWLEIVYTGGVLVLLIERLIKDVVRSRKA